jgi:hypothetical protein
MKRAFVLLAGVLALGLFPPRLPAPGLCAVPDYRTLREKVADAPLILHGRLVHPPGDKRETGEKIDPDTTDLVIERVLKGGALYTFPRTVNVAPREWGNARETPRCVILCDVFKGRLDPYTGWPDPSGELASYLKNALALPAGDQAGCVRYFFAHLEHANEDIAGDAWKELDRLEPADLRVLGPALPANRIARWLEAPGVPAQRLGLYARLLGYCGTKKHAEVLRKLLDDPRTDSRCLEHVLSAYVVLEPKEGWARVRDFSRDGKTEFRFRYGALRAARFLWDQRPDLVTHADVAEAVAVMLDQSDIADLVVDDLRLWGRWDMLDRVLSLEGKKFFEVAPVRRAVVRFALRCPVHPAAERFLAGQSKKDPQWVADVEELLKLEEAMPGN